MELRTFQKRFIKGALAPGVDVAALSIPRGGGKSALAAYILERCLTPGDDLHVAGAEYLLCSGSIEQARIVYRFLRAEIEPTGEYRFIDSTTRLSVTHKPTNTKLRVLSSNAKTAMGIVGSPVLVADAPALGSQGWHWAAHIPSGAWVAGTARGATLRTFPLGPYADYAELRAAVLSGEMRQIAVRIGQNDADNVDAASGVFVIPNINGFYFGGAGNFRAFPAWNFDVDPIGFTIAFDVGALNITADSAIDATPNVSVRLAVWG